jgi:hypothetical protein
MAKRYRASGPSEKHFPIVAILLGFILVFVIWYFFFRREWFSGKKIEEGFYGKKVEEFTGKKVEEGFYGKKVEEFDNPEPSPCDSILTAGDCDKNTLCSWGLDPTDATKTKNKCMAKPPVNSADAIGAVKNAIANITAAMPSK